MSQSAGELGALFTADEEAIYQVTNAFAFSKDVVHLCVEAQGEDEDEDSIGASALVRVELGPTIRYEVVHTLDSDALNYFARGADDHFMLVRGGSMHRWRNGKHSWLEPASDDFVTGLRAFGDDGTAVFGDDGKVFVLCGDVYTPVATETEERINDMFFASPDQGFAVGNYGTVLSGGATGMSALPGFPSDAFAVPDEPRSRFRVVAVHALSDGTLLLGSDEGPAYAFANGELVQLEGLEEATTVNDINVFRGHEYWGADNFGVYGREGDELVPKFGTEAAMTIQTSEAAMTITAGAFVYVWDGTDWIELQVHPTAEPGKLVERIPLDFEPQ